MKWAAAELRSWLRLAASIGADPTGRLERVLAGGRALLTVSGLFAIYLDPTQPARFATVTYTVLAAYALYSLGVLALVHRAPRLSPSHGLALHGLDILWTAGLTFVSEGPVSPFFLFFLFVVLSAAYRWAFIGTMATTAITIVVFLLQTAVAAAAPWGDTVFSTASIEVDRVILRVAYLLLTGFLLGYLAQQDKRTRTEIATIASLTRLPRVDIGLGGSIAAVSRGLLRAFEARSVAFVLQDFDTHETSLWMLDRSHLETAAEPARLALTTEQQGAWFYPDPGRAWEATRPASAGAWRTRAIDADRWPLRRGATELPPEVASAAPCSRMVAVNLGLADEWRGRVYLFDPAAGGSAEQAVHFLHELGEHVAPALTNVFLIGRLRARDTAAERARVARELHDGAIQALFGLEMKVEALRRAHTLPVALEAELEDVRDTVRREVLALRELMQALRPIPLDTSEQLPDVLAGVVERFRRDTGVPARFVFSGRHVTLSPATALELVRIVQEALVNVRKHSRARNVLIRLNGAEHGCTVVVEDDGVGFDFDGTLTGEELDRRRLGPAIIKERARIAGAALSIDSMPGSGARIELTLGMPS